MEDSIIENYRSRVLFAEARINHFDKLANRYSFLRLATILFSIVIIYQVIQLEIIWLVELAFFFLIVLFAFLVKRQGDYERKKAFFQALKTVNENEISSITEQSNIYSNGEVFSDDKHNYSSDLDIFGEASLFNLVNRSASPLGREKLAGWFSAPANKEAILGRQEAINELAVKLDWVQDVKAILLFARDTEKKDILNLIQYFETGGEPINSLLKTYVRFVPFIFIGLAAGAWFYSMLIVPLVIVALTNAILVLSHQLRVNKTDRVLSRLGKTLYAYSDGFKKIEEEVWQSQLCLSLSDALTSQTRSSFSAELRKLSVLVGRLEYRLNIFVGLLLNGVAAWDVRQLIAIEEWRTANKSLMPGAFEVLSSFESLISLSSLCSNFPEWSFPEIAEGEKYTYSASELAHPLIPSSKRISNDFQLDNSLKIDIITGSNMAGKSTFLRTLGINAVLALAGAPVCAKSMRISVINLFAYMRIRDSLNESISTFKAELNRLQLLLEVLDREGKVYFLIDEMLRGTNSVDKYRGSKAVVEKLISKQAVGIVATHDLQLAHLEAKYPAYIRNFYFDIQVINNEMLFDYKLKEGECKTFNASLLLKQIGIEAVD